MATTKNRWTSENIVETDPGAMPMPLLQELQLLPDDSCHRCQRRPVEVRLKGFTESGVRLCRICAMGMIESLSDRVREVLEEENP